MRKKGLCKTCTFLFAGAAGHSNESLWTDIQKLVQDGSKKLSKITPPKVPWCCLSSLEKLDHFPILPQFFGAVKNLLKPLHRKTCGVSQHQPPKPHEGEQPATAKPCPPKKTPGKHLRFFGDLAARGFLCFP